MFRFLAAFVAVVVLLVAAGSAGAHGGRTVLVRDHFGNVRAVRVNDFHGSRFIDPRFVDPRFVHPRFVHPRFVDPRFRGVTPFNQDGGPNRIGRRR